MDPSIGGFEDMQNSQEDFESMIDELLNGPGPFLDFSGINQYNHQLAVAGSSANLNGVDSSTLWGCSHQAIGGTEPSNHRSEAQSSSANLNGVDWPKSRGNLPHWSKCWDFHDPIPPLLRECFAPEQLSHPSIVQSPSKFTLTSQELNNVSSLLGMPWLVGDQTLAGIQLATHPQLGQPSGTNEGSQAAARDQDKQARKRAIDRAYRQREKDKKQKLEVKIQALEHELQKSEQEIKSTLLKQKKLEAEKEQLKEENFSLNRRLENRSSDMNLLSAMIEYIEKQMTKLQKQKPKKKQKRMAKKEQVIMVETAAMATATEETKNDKHSSHHIGSDDKNDN